MDSDPPFANGKTERSEANPSQTRQQMMLLNTSSFSHNARFEALTIHFNLWKWHFSYEIRMPNRPIPWCTLELNGLRPPISDRWKWTFHVKQWKWVTNDGSQHFSGSKKMHVSRVLRVLRVLRVVRALRALWFQCSAAVFASRRCFGLSLQLIVLLRFEANFEFQKCAVTSSSFRRYRV